ncbi:MAG: hypothetical protein M9924_05770 [Rhizobiaceae bacterium]|nr:hypothetical protein [Rhizobiaceae bacterium]
MSWIDVAVVTRRFELHEFAIRRLYASNPDFRVVCEDYAAATRALAFWEADLTRAEDYRRLVGELEAEILEFLNAPRQTTDRGWC